MEDRGEVINRGWLPKGVGFPLEIRKRKQFLKGNTVNVCGAVRGWGVGGRKRQDYRS